MNEISLTSSMRANLLALQDTSALIGTTQKRLATGLKVNSALDNPSSYYAANSLNNRAGDLSVLLDAMGQGIQTIKAATEGVDVGIQILEQMRSVTEQALQQPQTTVVEEEVVEPENPMEEPKKSVELTTRDISEFEAEGYTVITADMTASQIRGMMKDGAKYVLADDVILDGTLSVLKNNVVIDGNGHTISYTGESRAIKFWKNATIRNLNVEYTFTGTKNPFHYAAIDTNGVDISSVIINVQGVGATGIDASGETDISSVTINVQGIDAIGINASGETDISSVTINVQGIDAIGISASGETDISSVEINAEGDNAQGINASGKADISSVTINVQGMDAIGINVSGETDISSVEINVEGDNATGVYAGGGNGTIDTLSGIQVEGENAQKIYNPYEKNAALFNDKNSSVYNGRANTDALLKEIGADALAATAANQFYVGSKTDAYFGQGQWYLPAIGEWAEAYGIDTSQIGGNYYGTSSGATGDNKILINDALSTLKGKGVEAEELDDDYWSSSELGDYSSWVFYMSNGYRSDETEDIEYAIRCFQLLENCFNGVNTPKIGDVMYTDLSYGSADNYDSSQNKTVAGVVTWISEDGKSAKIVNLKELSFSSYDKVGNFNPDNPYNNTYKYSCHSTYDKCGMNVEGIDNFSGQIGLHVLSLAGQEPVITYHSITSLQNADVYAKQFNELLEQYDMLVGDSTYKGINLLNGDVLSVIFNEDMSSRLNMSGNDIRSAHIGLGQVTWEQVEDVQTAAEAVSKAILQLRDVSFELGNSYSIIQNRQDFTQSLINVLTEGADNLTLADMNEEAANMLALQTRQQLGVTALNLSSQSARSVLNLFQS